MKISNHSADAQRAVEQAKQADKLKAPKTGVHEGTAKTGALGPASVEISENAKLMQHASQIAKSSPDVRPDKVAELKKKIQDGTYEIDSAKIADKLVEEHLNNHFGKNDL